MTTYSVADAKNSLPKLIDRALGGEEVVITRHGKPVVELRPVPTQETRSTDIYDWLRSRRLPSIGISSVDLLDLMYEHHEP